MHNPHLFTIRSVNDPLITKHYHKLVELVRQGIKAEHEILAERPNYHPSLAFPLDKDEDTIGRDISGFLHEGVGTFHIIDDVLVGVGFAFPIDAQKCMIGPLSVDVNFRRRGICKGMIEKLEEEMRVKGMKASVLIVLENNPAVELYKQQGYGNESLVLGRAL